ncbi:unnamed protein product [Cuscuta campestris]|uniref:Uncharacterized protein n=1 Tax=Cuscuta campestris TaxID=132261 RepID=A0A484LKX3_9ASTE|nr:unnamed protein product [Cuscuta campestris]
MGKKRKITDREDIAWPLRPAIVVAPWSFFSRPLPQLLNLLSMWLPESTDSVAQIRRLRRCSNPGRRRCSNLPPPLLRLAATAAQTRPNHHHNQH